MGTKLSLVLSFQKENIDGQEHKRPCFYAIKDRIDDIYWMIPISSQITKYQNVLNQKLQKYPVYDGLEFGYVRGRYAAFLLQNLCPVTVLDEWALQQLIKFLLPFIIFIIVIAIIVKILQSPFKYPYFVHVFDVSGKRNPQIENLLDDFLINDGFKKIVNYRKIIENWKDKSKNKLNKSLLKKLPKKQHTKLCKLLESIIILMNKSNKV